MEEMRTIWTPDLIGPIFKRPSVTTLREVLNAHRNDKFTRTMATFVPDELIYEADLSKTNSRNFTAVMGLIDVSRVFDLYENHVSAANGGSYALVALLNKYLSFIIEAVYANRGDVLKFSRKGLLVMWKTNANDFIASMVRRVILCGQKLQEAVSSVKIKDTPPKVDVAVSAGEVTFSVIGDDNARHFVIGGSPIDDLTYARRICLPGDLVLSSSAWDHCAPNQYEYVIKDSNNVKIIKVLGPHQGPDDPSVSKLEAATKHQMIPSSDSLDSLDSISAVFEINQDGAVPAARASLVEALKRNLGAHLKTYLLKPTWTAIIGEESLEYLTEVRRVTVVALNIIPSKSSVYELISLVDEAFRLVQRYLR
ncbi:adenylate cyclase type 10-like [Andrena cerasifolii]|uniref:adenylate cyclase type 10-like n=1 Tax=Andrena cerasifolii TaxID=2819439 RepID=UPI0040381644